MEPNWNVATTISPLTNLVEQSSGSGKKLDLKLENQISKN